MLLYKHLSVVFVEGLRVISDQWSFGSFRPLAEANILTRSVVGLLLVSTGLRPLLNLILDLAGLVTVLISVWPLTAIFQWSFLGRLSSINLWIEALIPLRRARPYSTLRLRSPPLIMICAFLLHKHLLLDLVLVDLLRWCEVEVVDYVRDVGHTVSV